MEMLKDTWEEAKSRIYDPNHEGHEQEKIQGSNGTKPQQGYIDSCNKLILDLLIIRIIN